MTDDGLTMVGPHRCPVCEGEQWYGRHLFPGDPQPALCPNHPADQPVALVPCAGAKPDPGDQAPSA